MSVIFYNREQFIQAYVAQFLAAYTASRYLDACQAGNQRMLENHPVEDALYLAQKAWEQVQKL